MRELESPFSRVAGQYINLGYSIIPILPHNENHEGAGKVPAVFNESGYWELMGGWERFATRMPSPVNLQYWYSYQNANIGFINGGINGVIAIDFDEDVDGYHRKILDLIPDSPIKKVGRRGFTAFYKHNGEPFKRWSRNGEIVVEIPKQTVIPPSIHPNGNAYQWQGLSLLEINKNDLPSLPADFVNLMNELFPKYERKSDKVLSIIDSHRIYDKASIDEIERALTFIDADCSYSDWIEIGFALKNELGEAGFDVFDHWSSTGSKYQPKSIKSKWQSFKEYGGKTIASVFRMAIDNGYQKEYKPFEFSVAIESGGNISEIANVLPTKKVENEKQNVEKKDLKSNELMPPESCTDLWAFINWANDTSPRPQPLLSMLAGLSLLSVLKGQKIQTEEGFRTNLYLLGVAGASHGKDHARKCVKRTLKTIGEMDLLGGSPKSSSGLIASLTREGKHRGVKLLLIDEFGRFLSSVTSKYSGTHLQQVVDIMLELFATASDFFVGGEYANRDKTNPRVDIDQPCLSVYAVTTPENFHGALTSGSSADGFLSRWIILETGKLPDMQSNFRPISGLPSRLIDMSKGWISKPKNTSLPEPSSGGCDLTEVLEINPAIIPYTIQSRSMIQEWRFKLDDDIRREDERMSGLGSVYGRIVENACKLALSAINLNDSEINESVIDWALRLSKYSADGIVEMMNEKVSDNATEAEYKKILSVIKGFKANDGWISRSNLCRLTRNIKPRTRNEYLIEMIENEEIEVRKSVTWNQKEVIEYRISE
ncbi:MAG: PriCT-2 domain-containing protein [Smithella sp.]